MSKPTFNPVSRGNWREDRTDTIKAAELKLLHTVGFIFGLIYMGLLIAKLEQTWYGLMFLLAFVVFCIGIVVRNISDLIKGEI